MRGHGTGPKIIQEAEDFDEVQKEVFISKGYRWVPSPTAAATNAMMIAATRMPFMVQDLVSPEDEDCDAECYA